jgi:4-hydroxy-tetrahydrodipicolinate synthase
MNQAGELWPVMLTPFTEGGSVDYDGLQKLIEFYEAGGADGLFAICQSSEIFYLSLAERVKIAEFVKKHAHIPVIASGHVSYSRADQADELCRVADTGVDAVILITNRLAAEGDDASVWMDNLDYLLQRLDPAMPLGFYECPMPYKRLISLDELKICAETGRFRFMKDTCCDLATIQKRLRVLQGSRLRLYNANVTTLLDSLRLGAAGFSGVMANFHPELYAWLLSHAEDERAEILQAALTMCAGIERQLYPVNAKYFLQRAGLPLTLRSRTQDFRGMSATFRDEVRQMEVLTDYIKRSLLKGEAL